MIYNVPHNPALTDIYTDADYSRDMGYLAKSLSRAPSDLVAEFKLIMDHFTSTLYHWEFRSCQSPSCPICPASRVTGPKTPLDHFYEKFGNSMPTPIPFWAAFPMKPPMGQKSRNVDYTSSIPHPSHPDGAPLHYRSFADIMKINIPTRMLHADQHYNGPTLRHQCPYCKPDVCHRSGAALLRHLKMIHG